MPTGTAGGPLLARRYRVIERLGSGGMAAVYLAHDERLDRRVAVKRLHTTGDDDTDARRFEREAKLGAALSHPNLVSIFDTEHDDESVLIVMEYVEGETLADRLRRGALSPAQTAEIVGALAGALDHAHANGIVHRDIKPGNVLLGKDGAVKLADLGIAKALERTDITQAGTVLGTPAYMAPEQLEGHELGPAVDVYALAAVTYEMLTGRKARTGRSTIEIAHRAVNEPPPDPRDAGAAISADAAAAVRDGMARDAADRPSSAGEFAARFESAIGSAGTAGPTRPTRRLEPAAPATETAEARPASPPRAPAPPLQPVRGGGPSRRLLAVLGLFAVALAAVALAVTSGGDGEQAADRAGDSGQGQAQEPDGGAEAGGEGEAAPEEGEGGPAEPEQAAGVPQPQGKGGTEKAHEREAKGYEALQAGDYAKAARESRRAIEAFPPGTTADSDLKYAYALFNLGRALRLDGRAEEAIPVLEARLEIPNQQDTVSRELEAARRDAGRS